MTVISSGTWPIDPTTTSGTELAAYLNEMVNAIQTSQASPSRPPAIQKGGVWTKTLGAADIALMLYDGTTDREIGKVVGGNATFGGTAVSNTAPTPATAGMLWVDNTLAGAPILKIYDGTAWAGVGGVKSIAPITVNKVQKRVGINTVTPLTTLDIHVASDGPIVNFASGVSGVGNISADGGMLSLFSPGAVGINIRGDVGNKRIIPRKGVTTVSDNDMSFGDPSSRWKDIHAANTGIIGTSDRNEKQDIEPIDAVEMRVAQSVKGLLRKFRWKNAYAEKGDGARIHFGIIAQDLQDAFAAEGLDAGRYGMFISNTWWEAKTDVPAVDAVAEVLDDDGNVVSEAVEAKAAYTSVEAYNTKAEAPKGAKERTRLGVRLDQVLAFILAAL